jgi:hypothetical protein
MTAGREGRAIQQASPVFGLTASRNPSTGMRIAATTRGVVCPARMEKMYAPESTASKA